MIMSRCRLSMTMASPDETADDGIYTGEIPPRDNQETVAFYLEATDKAGYRRTWPRTSVGPRSTALKPVPGNPPCRPTG
jgi:hypothetical protein